MGVITAELGQKVQEFDILDSLWMTIIKISGNTCVDVPIALMFKVLLFALHSFL